MTIRNWLLVGFASLLALPPGALAAGLPTRTLTIRGHSLVVEVAATGPTRETGLMNRFSLAARPRHAVRVRCRRSRSRSG